VKTYRCQAKAWLCFDVAAETEEQAMKLANDLMDENEEGFDVPTTWGKTLNGRCYPSYPTDNDGRDISVVDEMDEEPVPATHTVVVPPDFPVQPVKPGDEAKDPMTCGTCGLTWDDAVSTGYTPVPSGRCPFEEFHR